MSKPELGRVFFGAGATIGVASTLYVATAVAARLWSRRSVSPRRWAAPPLLSLVGSGLAFAAPATAQFEPATPSRPNHVGSHSPPAPPWSEPGRFPPPRPAGRTGEASPTHRAARAEDAEVGKPPMPVRRVVVQPGDSLWSIAAEILETSDPARIARYWPRIHQLNRQLIGADPNLIFPGQVLELPDESPRK
jgi:resuscitation-promoting factor RpfA